MRWLVALLLVACNQPRSPRAAATGIEWIEDDYPRALAAARASNRPLFIDAWAPWCHSCLSMKSFVFPDAARAPVARDFVWLAIDTEKPGNAPVLARFPVTTWPTFLVVDPADESVQGRWVGSATLTQLRDFLVEGRRRVRAGGSGPLAQADAAALRGEWRRAAQLYAAAGDAPELLVARIEALWRAGDHADCVALGRAKMGDTGSTQSAVDFASFAISCTEEVDDEALRRLAEARLVALLGAKNELAADDRGAAYQILWELRGKRGDAQGARKAAEDLLADLGEAARRAPDAHAASTFNAARSAAYLFLGRGPEAVAMLEASEQALPDDYNPPHLLARVHRQLGDLDAALAALERSLAKAYGPRKAALLGLKGDLLEKKGDLLAAARAFEEQIAFYEALPVEQRSADRLARARESAARCRKARATAL